MDTWSYSILGNDDAMECYYKYTGIIIDHLPESICEVYHEGIPDEVYQQLIEKYYGQLVECAHKHKSRLAFFVLGEFLMSHGAKLTEDLKQKILKYSDWRYEKDQLKKKKDRLERKKFLAEFREKIISYNGTEEVFIPLYTVTRVINEKKAKGEDFTKIWRKNIDYSISD